jgi:hypothetical protein
MEPPPDERGLSLTLSWGGGASRRRRSAPLGPAFRVALALSLCAACYEAGRWRQRLEAQSEARPDSRVVVVERGEKPPVRAESPGPAPGGAIGDKDVITPLNVRDPSALVMGPSDARPVPQAAPPAPGRESDVPEANPPARIFRTPQDIKPNRRF